MGKKMKLQWPSCKYPKTLSFRAGDDDIFKTVNSVFFDPCVEVETPESWFTNSSSESASFSTESEDRVDNESLEIIVREARSDRLFFQPGGATSSILEESKSETTAFVPFKESVMLSMESQNPYVDFRRSMEEMVEAHRLKDWDCLEELLGWYLKVNGKNNHGFIIDAFVDLLVSLASAAEAEAEAESKHHHDSIATSYSSAVSSFDSSSSCLSPNLGSIKGEIQIVDLEEKLVLL